MELSDKFTIEHSSCGSVSEHLGEEYPSITNRSIGLLINLLNDASAIIDPDNCEKVGVYDIKGQTKKSMVLLDTPWNPLRIESYFLRGAKGLEIELNDFQTNPSVDLADGESYTFTKGINCRLAFSGILSMQELYKGIIKEFYELKEH